MSWLQWHRRTPQTPQEIKDHGIRYFNTVIDNLLYELYGCTDEEISIVDGR